jgi:hypothetical protein
MKMKVGEKLWFVPADWSSPYEVTISEIDGKWAILSYVGHVDIKTLAVYVNGEDKPIGQCYPSEGYYLARKK